MLFRSGPAVASPGRTNDTLVHAVDVFATILDMAGISNAATLTTNVIDSQSVMPTVRGVTNLTRYSYSEKFGTNTATTDGRALRNAQFKLIRFDAGRDEFYDLVSDPFERTNLLTAALTATQQANYSSLDMRLGLYQDTLAAPVITSFNKTNAQFTVTVPRTAGLSYRLWRAAMLDDLAWAPLNTAVIVTNGSATVTLTDSNADTGFHFYRVRASSP